MIRLRPNPLDAGAWLGRAKVWPGSRRASGQRTATANLDSPSTERPAMSEGRGEGKARLSNKGNGSAAM